LPVKICTGSTYLYQGVSLAVGQNQQFTLINPATGCDSLVNLTVQGLALPITDLMVNVCPGQKYTYNGQQLEADSTYEFHFKTHLGECDSTVYLTVDAYPLLQFNMAATASCAGTPTGVVEVQNVLGGTPPVVFSWDNAIFQNNLILNEIAAGTYTAVLKDAAGCTYTQPVEIPERSHLQVMFPAGLLLPCDTPLALLNPILGGDLTGLKYIWSTGASTANITVTDIGVYALKVSNVCETIERSSEVKWADGPEGKDFVYVPNVVQPDGVEQANSVFHAFVSPSVELIRFKMEIFDRWGNLKFRSLDPDTSWECYTRSKSDETAVYIWYLEMDVIYCGQKTTIRRKGDVTVVR